MSYIDGFVIAAPTANKRKLIDHAKLADSVFIDLGATRVAVQAKEDETWSFLGSNGPTSRPETRP